MTASTSFESAHSGAPREIVIRGGQRGVSIDALREVWAYREVMYALTRRGIATRYRQSALGFVWILAGPLSSAGLYAIFLGGLGGLKGDRGTSYTMFVYVGTIIWGIFLRGGLGGMTSLVMNTGFVKKVYFPRVLLPLSQVIQSLADLVPGIALMAVLGLMSGSNPRMSWFLLALPILTATLASMAFAVATSVVNVYFRDLNYASPLLTQFGLLASAVVFPLSRVPASWRTLYAIGNPMAGAIDVARAVTYRGDGLNMAICFGGLAWSIVLLVIAYMIFSVLERDVADRI